MTQNNFEHVDGYYLKKKVRAIVTNEAMQHLLVRPHGYDNDSWTFIGGGVETGETDIEALRRELKEEASIDYIQTIRKAKFVNWFTFSDEFKAKKNFDYDGQFASYFHVTIPNDTIIKIQEDEVADFCWCDQDSILNFIKVPKHAEIFQQLAKEFNFQGQAI